MNEYPLKILVDLDGTVADIHTPWIEAINRDHGTSIKTLDPEDMAKYAEQGIDVLSYLNYAGFYLSLRPLPGAVEGIKGLVDAGHHVVICTDAGYAEHAACDKKKWMNTYLPMINRNDIITTQYKDWITADLLIEDNPRHLIGFVNNRANKASNSYAIGIRTPYNTHVRHPRVSLFESHEDTANAWQQMLYWIYDYDSSKYY